MDGVDRSARCFGLTDSGELVIGGSFKYADGIEVNGISSWNGQSFDSILSGASNCFNACGPIVAIHEFADEIYVGGYISQMGNQSVSGIAKWNGQTWQNVSLGLGVSGYGRAQVFSLIDDVFFVGGVFDTAGSIAANSLAILSNATWQSAMNFPNTHESFDNLMTVQAIVEFDDDIYVAGAFPPNDTLSRNIIKWNGNDWVSVGTGINGVSSWLNDAIVFNGKLYVAGYFSQSDGNVSSGVMAWDGMDWIGLGNGVNIGAQVFDLEVFQGNLFASGNFTTISGIPANKIAKWNGSQWCSLGSSFNNSVTKMVVYRDTLHVACGTIVDGIEVNYLAKWLGGNYVDTCVTITGVEYLQGQNRQLIIHPNPTTSTTTITWHGQNQGNYHLQLFDAQGRRVTTPVTSKTSGEWEMDMRGLAPGIYFGRLVVGEETRSFKVVRE